MITTGKIVAEFNRIKNLEFIKSNRIGNTGIGKTFEDYLGVKENNLKDPDFEGFEVKSKRKLSTSLTTWFTQNPTSPKGINAILRERFGYKVLGIDHNELHTTPNYGKYNVCKELFGFKVEINEDCERIELHIKNLKNGDIEFDNIYWSFDNLRDAINAKLTNLFLVKALKDIREDGEYFHYTEASVYFGGGDFDKFLQFIKEGKIKIDIRLGTDKDNKPHDHGTGFRVDPKHLVDLYCEELEIK
jgi:MvaI/BcnI restriction endonuclease family